MAIGDYVSKSKKALIIVVVVLVVFTIFFLTGFGLGLVQKYYVDKTRMLTGHLNGNTRLLASMMFLEGIIPQLNVMINIRR